MARRLPALARRYGFTGWPDELIIRQSPFPAWRWELITPEGVAFIRFRTDARADTWLTRHGYGPLLLEAAAVARV